MALMKDGLWGIVSETERDPGGGEAEAHRKFVSRRDHALAIIVLSVEPSLLYLIGDPEDPVAVWNKLKDQFQKKTWANKLELRRKLYSLRLKDGESVQKHIKAMTELFEALAVIDAPVSEEDKVVHLLASLPDSFGMLVTALEANSEVVPKMENVTERLLHEEQKLKEKESENDGRKALTASGTTPRQLTCHFCKKPGHFKRNCRKFAAQLQANKDSANKAAARESSSSSDDEAMVVSHALSATSKGTWIIDSGATCHMCNDRTLFSQLHSLQSSQEVTLGDGHVLQATSEGTVPLQMLLPDGRSKKCNLHNVLLVPKLSHNLLSVSKASELGKTTKFYNTGCEILNESNKVIAFATKVGSLYFLEVCRKPQQLNLVEKKNKERLWHRRYGHLSECSLQKLAKKELVTQFDYNVVNSIGFCETCVGGKHHRSHFETSTNRAKELLELVHTDVCGRMREKSIGGAEYFLTFTDDKSRYTWVYPLKRKDQVFDQFLKWKSLVENSCGKRLKTLRSDNGGEYTSNKFEAYLTKEGIRHECTIPKTPEQNGVAERLNRTLVESSRSMLLDAKLPKKYWAEAISTAVYLKNRCPTKSIKDMTPYEAWHGVKPRVDHLRVFGCEAYVHIPKDERGKFDSKARKCILVGYGQETKGYRLYDTQQQKILHSRDVRFNEENEQADAGDDLDHPLVLDLSSDPEPEDSHSTDDGTAEPVLRRSTRERRQPNYYGRESSNLTIQGEPTSFEEATGSSDSSKWMEAMETEMKSLKNNDVWDLTPLPAGKQAVGSKWVYKIKTGVDGSIQRFKARLVAQGFTQRYGTDYDETFSPVVRQESLRVLLALSVQCGSKLHQVDVTTAFLNGNLEDEVYMKQPPGFAADGKEHLVCKLKKSIYGLKQSPRCWNTALDSHLKEMGFVPSTSDPCIYMDAGGARFHIGVFVDDMVLAGQNEERIAKMKDDLSHKFDIKDMGRLHYFLGMTVVQDETQGSVWIGQPLYTESVLKRFGMQDCKPVATPVDVSTKLVTATKEECVDQRLYQSAVGSLMYLSVSTRPDIAYAVSNLARFSSNPTENHWKALKRVLRYLRGTVNFGILYSPNSSPECIGFSDADWAGDTNDRKSTSGYLFILSGGAVTWKSKKQSCVALSTAEAEYIALSSAAQESVWLRQLTSDLGSPPKAQMTLFEDNQSAIAMSKNPQFHGRTKHVEIKHHFIREQVNEGNVKLEYCPSEEQTADMFTKGLSREQFCRLRSKAGIVSQDIN